MTHQFSYSFVYSFSYYYYLHLLLFTLALPFIGSLGSALALFCSALSARHPLSFAWYLVRALSLFSSVSRPGARSLFLGISRLSLYLLLSTLGLASLFFSALSTWPLSFDCCGHSTVAIFMLSVNCCGRSAAAIFTLSVNCCGRSAAAIFTLSVNCCGRSCSCHISERIFPLLSI